MLPPGVLRRCAIVKNVTHPAGAQLERSEVRLVCSGRYTSDRRIVTALKRIRVSWTGFPGAPGVSTFYSLDSVGAPLTELHAFFSSLAGKIPADVNIQVENSGDIIEDTTGALTGTWTDASVLSVQGTGSSMYAAPAGILFKWMTDTVLGGHRIRGRTFLVPADVQCYQNDGSIASTPLGQLQGYAATLVAATAGAFVIWHRPRAGVGGGHALVTGSTVPDKVVVLRSRRD